MFCKRRRKTDETIENLHDAIHRIQKVLDKMSEHRVQVTVENLRVDHASLEQLVFRLDSIDIDELSGSLNLGNNFGTDAVRNQKNVTRTTHQENNTESADDKVTPDTQQTQSGPDGQMLSATPSGYRVSIKM